MGHLNSINHLLAETVRYASDIRSGEYKSFLEGEATKFFRECPQSLVSAFIGDYPGWYVRNLERLGLSMLLGAVGVPGIHQQPTEYQAALAGRQGNQ